MIILTMLLTACSAVVTTNNPSTSGAAQVTEAIQVENTPALTGTTTSVDAQKAGLSTNYTDAVPVEAQLLLGTLKTQRNCTNPQTGTGSSAATTLEELADYQSKHDSCSTWPKSGQCHPPDTRNKYRDTSPD